ncbi:MAG: hypothetical protein HY964_02620 [Ignavibacteriales bacterium]|nr:hypothetical protein [Ignavibacteriales bacterium]
MNHTISFNEILEEAERLSLEEQETLLEILNRRIMNRRRSELAKDIQDAQSEFREGKTRTATPDELMNEIMK